LTGIACPFISCIPTKVSQHWFNEEQRTLATILIGMSNPLGIVLGQAITPLIVRSPEDVPIMNIVWFVPAAFGALLTMWKVNKGTVLNLPETRDTVIVDKGSVSVYILGLMQFIT
jgi:hypothetical protein